METQLNYLHTLDDRADELLEHVCRWSAINSGSYHRDGVSQMAGEVATHLRDLGIEVTLREVPPLETVLDDGTVEQTPLGPAVHAVKEGKGPRLFLCAHLDTVFDANSTFQTPVHLSPTRLGGPGVADIKGGMVVMLAAVETVLASPYADRFTFEALFNPDEETGSLSSQALLEDCGRRCDYGLIFEPSYPDGAFVDARKGSANYSVVVHGRRAHSGRDWAEGRNAISALAKLIVAVDKLSVDDVTVNVGKIHGGEAVNVVAPLAVTHINIRAPDANRMEATCQAIEAAAHQLNHDGITVELHGGITRPPKPLNEPTKKLFALTRHCAETLGQPFQTRSSGGVCDGNIVGAVGLPTIDTLGVVGGGMHTHDEYMEIPSLVDRAKLTALLMMQLIDQHNRED